jgi:hypothetical protein
VKIPGLEPLVEELRDARVEMFGKLDRIVALLEQLVDKD